jgi:two-component sensor histidine kinase
MKFPKIFKTIITSTWFLAIIPAILFTVFLHPDNSRYNLNIEETKKNFGQFEYPDLNGDSISEIVYTGKGLPYYFLSIFDMDMHVYDQWNFFDSLSSDISHFFIGNYDHDKYKEIYIFTFKQDSLFLNVNEILDPDGLKINREFIIKIGYLGGKAATWLRPAGFFDTDGDGKDELYFIISPHYRSAPRRIIWVNLETKKKEDGPKVANMILFPVMKDVDGDSRPEIFGSMSASGNYRANVPYSDSSTWLMVYDDKLRFKFPPVEFRGFGNGLFVNSFKNDKEKGYVAIHQVGGADTTVIKEQVMIYDTAGKLLRYRLLSDLGLSKIGNAFTINKKNDDRIYLIGNNFIEVNTHLDMIRSIPDPFLSIPVSYTYDINNDGEDEIILYSFEEKKIIVYNAELKKLAEKFLVTPENEWRFSDFFSKAHVRRAFMNSGNMGYFFNLRENKYFFLGYSYYPGIYLLFFIFIFLIKRITTIQIEQRESLKRKLVTLQLQSIKGQLDPHFTFNTLNSISSLIYLEDRQKAYDYMNKFTQLLRTMLNDAERIYRSLSEELQFVNTYLELEKLRFGDKFNYVIETGPGVTKKEQVPKLVLQTFAENSIKHGILPREGGGLLKIIIERNDDYLKIVIEDNGVGMAATVGKTTGTGKGLKLAGEFYDTLNQINKKPIDYAIVNLVDSNGHSTGTRVEVCVPLDI